MFQFVSTIGYICFNDVSTKPIVSTMKNSIQIKFYFLETKTRKAEHPIYCRITVNRLKAEFNTGFSTPPNKWNEEKERVTGNLETNAMLLSIEDRLNGIYFERTYAKKEVTAKIIKDVFLGKDKSNMRLVEYFEVYIHEMATLTKDYSHATLQKYKTIQRHLLDFLKQSGKSNILITGFYSQNIHEFEYHLKSKACLNTNTVAKYLKIFKSIYIRAIQFGYLATNPFEGYKFKTQKTNRTFLTKEELQKIENLEISNHSIQKVRDCFIFSVYTGLRYSDVYAISHKNLKVDNEGKHWLELQMQKTKDPLRVPILDKAIEIINRYELEGQISGKLLPAISNQKINSYLKVIAELCDLDKLLTFHVARHTFATTITLSNNIPIEIVSKLLGHTTIETTQVYAKITNDYLQAKTLELNQIYKV